MILFEYPFNERIRTYLRLEQLLQRLNAMIHRENAHDHHFALFTLFELMDVAARADLKADILKDLERQKTLINSYRGNPAISEIALNQVVSRLDTAYERLNAQHGKAGSELLSNDWLMNIRSRSFIPGGSCSFDLPGYHAWLHMPSPDRKMHLQAWAAVMTPLSNAVALLLQLLRESGTPQRVIALQGQYQQPLPQVRSFQLARVVLSDRVNLIPEISGNRLMISVRMMLHAVNSRLEVFKEDVAFELTLCAGG